MRENRSLGPPTRKATVDPLKLDRAKGDGNSELALSYRNPPVKLAESVTPEALEFSGVKVGSVRKAKS